MTETTHYNILLVEDNAPNVLAATAMLESLGYTYLVATSGIQAVKSYITNTFDMILMDIQMPSMSGIETTALIRTIETKLSIRTPIIAMTAHMHKTDMKIMDDSFDDFVPKPFHPDYFSKVLSKYCK